MDGSGERRTPSRHRAPTRSRPVDSTDGLLDERVRELDLLQAVGRAAAEARAVDELFASVVGVLERGHALDLALAVYERNGMAEAAAFLGRPVAEACLDDVQRRTARVVGREPPLERRQVRRQLSGYDEARGAVDTICEEDLAFFPILRDGQPVGCLSLATQGPLAEDSLRVVYSAANQLTLHLDRILSAREAEADRFRTMVDSMPQAVVLATEDLRLAHVNRAGRELIEQAGLGAADDPLRPLLERLGLAELAESVRRGDRGVAESEVRLCESRVFAVTVSALGSGARELLIVLTDITQIRGLQERLATAEKMSSLGKMISGITHELNNPLTSIVGYAQLIRRGCTDDTLAGRLELLERESERCRKIVHNLLSFARRREPQWTWLSLNQVVADAATLLDYQLRVEDVTIEVTASPDVPPIQGDPHQLGQVLINLVTNAAQAIRQAGRAGVVRLATRVDADRAVLEVRDSGPGIPEQHRTRIFDPFFTTKPEGQGTGLGLALVYGIVDAHGGDIRLVPCAEGGAAFRLCFPVRAASAGAGEAAQRETSPAAPVRGRILVVEDEDVLGQLISDVLEQDGHSIARAADGRAALRQLREREFDLVIADFKMPGMNGQRLHAELQRVRPSWSDRLLLTSGDTVGRQCREFVAATGVELLYKPFDVDELRERVRVRLGSRTPV